MAGLGTFGGAVYKPVLLIVPQAVPLHPVPERLQITAPFVELNTILVNCTDSLTYMLAVLGVIDTLIGAGGVVSSTPQAEMSNDRNAIAQYFCFNTLFIG